MGLRNGRCNVSPFARGLDESKLPNFSSFSVELLQLCLQGERQVCQERTLSRGVPPTGYFGEIKSGCSE